MKVKPPQARVCYLYNQCYFEYYHTSTPFNNLSSRIFKLNWWEEPISLFLFSNIRFDITYQFFHPLQFWSYCIVILIVNISILFNNHAWNVPSCMDIFCSCLSPVLIDKWLWPNELYRLWFFNYETVTCFSCCSWKLSRLLNPRRNTASKLGACSNEQRMQ